MAPCVVLQVYLNSVSYTHLERVAKYNQLLRIEEMLYETAQYKGNDVFYNLK